MTIMKDSGIEWIGQIPKEWETISFSNGVLGISTGLNPRDNFELSKDDEYYYVTIKNFKDGKIYLDDNCDRISKQAWGIIQERSQLEKGDILFASISKDGQAYIIEEPPVNWNINESVFTIRTNHEYFYDKYFYYHLIDSEYYNDLRLDATGTTFHSIKQNKLRKSILCLPPLSEQQKIANYLDKVCGDIDKMVALQEQMIEELKAYKQSIITEAVTKGLNPNVPMKNSGIDWIGFVPQDWRVARAKYFVTVNHGSDPHEEGDIPVYGSGASSFKTCGEYKEGAAVLVGRKGATLHIPHYIEGRYWNVDTAFDVKIRKEMILKYYYYLAICFDYKYYISQTTLPGMAQSSYYNMQIPIPSMNEQQQIASHLDTKCSEINSLIAIKRQKIEELKEYKKSVIYEYVTGKKEVV